MAGFGHKLPFIWALRKVRLGIRKRAIARIGTAHNEFFVGDVSFAIQKRKKLANGYLVAF